jgi:lysophospholipase L1-like esterase
MRKELKVHIEKGYKSFGKFSKTHLLLLVLLAILPFGCAEDEGPMTQNEFPTAPGTTGNNVSISVQSYTYLALGDSYTIGQGVDEEARWPNQLKTELKKELIDLKKVDIIAQTGWTTNDLIRGINTQNPGNYDLVSLLIGVNNQYQKKPFSQFEKEFDELLDTAIDLAGGKQSVFVVSIPDYSVTRFGSGNPGGIASEINGYNGYIRQQCLTREILLIDITEISRDLGSRAGALAGDGLHPSAQQYAKWVEKILPEVNNLLKNKND